MNFETAFAHYQAHTATAEETALVERELEKYRLIEDYLAEQELPELPEDAAAAASAETKAVKRRLNRRTGWTVLAAVAAVLAILALLQFVISPLVNRRVYYVPWREEADYDIDTYSEFDAGMSAITALYMPLGSYGGSLINHTGFMTDTVDLGFLDNTGATRSGIGSQVTLRMGKLGWLNANDLSVLGYGYMDFRSWHTQGGHTKAALEQLPDYFSVTSAVTFTRDLTADELAALMERHPELTFLSAKMEGELFPQALYCSLQNTGVQYGSDLNRDYPDFQFGDYPDFQVETVTGESIQQHFESLLQYLIDHPKLADMADALAGGRQYQRMLDTVREDGLKSSGVWVQGTPAAILALLEESCAAGVANRAAVTVLSK